MIIVDESGSMCVIEKQALAGLNETIETVKKMQKAHPEMQQRIWTFTLIGTDNLDVEGMAGQMSIDNHLSFAEDAEGTREMFRRERKARVRYNECLATGCSMGEGSYFDESLS